MQFYVPAVEYVDDAVIHGFRSAEITLDVRMTEIICYAPIWNSTKWIRKSVLLTVQSKAGLVKNLISISNLYKTTCMHLLRRVVSSCNQWRVK